MRPIYYLFIYIIRREKRKEAQKRKTEIFILLSICSEKKKKTETKFNTFVHWIEPQHLT